MSVTLSKDPSLPLLQYRHCGSSIKRFLRMGLIGEIGHISCRDIQPSAVQGSPQHSTAIVLGKRAAGQLAELANLLETRPTAVMVGGAPNDATSTMQVFLTLGIDAAVHYSTSFRDSISEHELWLEGSKGSLRTNGRSVWWRKHGWPLFAPVTLPFSPSGFFKKSSSITSELLADLESAIVTSGQRGSEVGLAGNKANGASA